MDSLSSLAYGIIQGVTEFLPVSSSGHLALLPHFLGIKDPGVIFDLSMHVGTGMAVFVYFYKDIVHLLSSAPGLIKNSFKPQNSEQSRLMNMTMATIFSVICILCVKTMALKYGRTPSMMAINLALFGVLMFVADTFKKDTDEKYMDKLDIKRSFFIGAFQAFAIFPGVSRSGSTLTISRLLNLGREEATRFSFLLSLPIIFAGFCYKLPQIFSGQVNFDIFPLLMGMVISFIMGLLTIHYFLKFIKKVGLSLFSFYRIVLALIVYWKLVA